MSTQQLNLENLPPAMLDAKVPLNSAVSTPGLDIPGAYPGDPDERPGYERTPSGGYKAIIHNSATAYIAPERLDQVEHLVEDVGSKAAAYVPAGVASVVSGYWCELKLVYRRRLQNAARTRASEDPRKKRGKAWRMMGWLIVGLAWMLGFDLLGRHPFSKRQLRALGEDRFFSLFFIYFFHENIYLPQLIAFTF